MSSVPPTRPLQASFQGLCLAPRTRRGFHWVLPLRTPPHPSPEISSQTLRSCQEAPPQPTSQAPFQSGWEQLTMPGGADLTGKRALGFLCPASLPGLAGLPTSIFLLSADLSLLLVSSKKPECVFRPKQYMGRGESLEKQAGRREVTASVPSAGGDKEPSVYSV